MSKVQDDDGQLKVSQLVYYPIKSCRGVAVDSWEFGPRGLDRDRLIMVVDQAKNFVSQRRFPKLASVVAEFISDTSLLVSQEANPKQLTLDISREFLDAGVPLEVTVWGDKCCAVDLGDEAAAWFSQTLEYPHARVVRISDDFARLVDPKHNPGGGHETGFSDGFPILLTTEESLAKLNEELESQGQDKVPMNRFRPNIVVTGCPEPWYEDNWQKVEFRSADGKVAAFELCKICERCKQIRVNQTTCETSVCEPTATLQRIRPEYPVAVFGQNLVALGSDGVLSVGDKLRVVSQKTLKSKLS